MSCKLQPRHVDLGCLWHLCVLCETAGWMSRRSCGMHCAVFQLTERIAARTKSELKVRMLDAKELGPSCMQYNAMYPKHQLYPAETTSGFRNAGGGPLKEQNVGLLDIQLAIEWVRDKTARFPATPTGSVFGSSCLAWATAAVKLLQARA